MPPSTACLCLPRKGFPIHTPLFCYFSFILLFKYAFQSFCHQATLAIACPRFARLLLQLPIRGTPHIVACGAATAPALRTSPSSTTPLQTPSALSSTHLFPHLFTVHTKKFLHLSKIYNINPPREKNNYVKPN